MSKIVPSTNKRELLTQLYIFRGMLGDVYTAAESYDDVVQNFDDEKTELRYRKSILLTDIAKRKKQKMKRIVSGILFSMLAIVVTVAMYFLGAFDKSLWFIVIPVVILLACGIYNWFFNGFYPTENYIKNISKTADEQTIMRDYLSKKIGYDVCIINEKGLFFKYSFIKSKGKLASFVSLDDYDKYVKEHPNDAAVLKIKSLEKELENHYKSGLTVEKDDYDYDYDVDALDDDYDYDADDIDLDDVDLDVDEIDDDIDIDGNNLDYLAYYKRAFVTKQKGMKDVFSDFLIERDWDKVDTLIYLVASGRADTLKEALNASDLIVRHDEVVGKLNEIRTSIDNQTQVMTECTRALLLGMNEINKSIKEVGTKIDSLRDCVMIAAASINATIDTSSTEMCERIGRISNQLYRM